MASLNMAIELNPSKDDLDKLEQGIIHYNVSLCGLTWKPLFILLRDNTANVVGGLIGHTEWGWLYVQLLYIEERYRHMGFGEALIAMAEDEGRARGCKHVHLETFGFQAPGFYRKLGYEVFGTLEDYPLGYTRYYLRKKL